MQKTLTYTPQYQIKTEHYIKQTNSHTRLHTHKHIHTYAYVHTPHHIPLHHRKYIINIQAQTYMFMYTKII